MTHLTVAYLVKRTVSPKQNMVPFLAGSTLPDLLSYIPLMTIGITVPLIKTGLIHLESPPGWLFEIPYCFYPFHALVPFMLLCWFFVLWCPVKARRGVFLNLVLGSMLHFALDGLQINPNEYSYFLFPFSMKALELGWIGTESSLYVVPFFTVAAATVLFMDVYKKRK